MSFTELVDTDYGRMLVARHDTHQTGALRATGKALCHSEITLLRELLKECPPDPVFLDIGANIGSFSFGVRDLCKTVHAFEAQRLIYYMMAGSVALNGWDNIHCHHVALGNRVGRIEIPQFDYNRPLNFGGVEFTQEQREPIGQPRQHDPNRLETIGMRPLDFFKIRRIDVMKVDVEGMECEVLAGARYTIRYTRPRFILIEHAKAGRENLVPILERFGYQIADHGTMDLLCTRSAS